MLLLSKTIHVLALGLWFGTLCFFTVAGLTLFQTFDEISLKDKDARPLWFPLPAEYAKEPPSDKFPDPLRKEQGSRAAGAAVGPLFRWYYGIQIRLRRLDFGIRPWAVGFARGRSRVHLVRLAASWWRWTSCLVSECGWNTMSAICERRETKRQTRCCGARSRRTRKFRRPWTRGQRSSAGTATVCSTTSRC